MSLFEQLGQRQAAPMNPMQMLQQVKQNPASVLKQAGIEIPANMRDPQQILTYMLQTRQRPQSMYNQILSRIGRR